MSPNFAEIESQLLDLPDSEAVNLCWRLLGGYRECARQKAELEAIICKKQ
jgi:hypothetical protein